VRSEQEIISQILHVANTNDLIRAVLLTGSRADPKIVKDNFQDFDITYIVRQLEPFLKDKHWIDVFGERLILQLPEEMTIGEKNEHAFHFLMLFKDGNRIDLTLFPLEKMKTKFEKDSLTIVLLDKDQVFHALPPPTDSDYLINPPTEKEFLDCCNEFWWVSTYVAKGLCRKEITYAKQMMDVHVRPMFLKVIEWELGALTGFAVSFGIAGRHMKSHISPELYNRILSTYPDSNIENIWKGLFDMGALFDELAKKLAGAMNFRYNQDEADNVRSYLTTKYESFQSNMKL
jgi:aminoglycoside 6-adenylyltransferase